MADQKTAFTMDLPVEAVLRNVNPIGNSIVWWEIEDTLTFTADASQSSTKQIPANSYVAWTVVKCTTAGVIDTGAALGIGFTGDLDAFGVQTFTSIDAVNDQYIFLGIAGFASNGTTTAPATSFLSSATTWGLYSVANTLTGGLTAATGTITSGTWAVKLVGFTVQSFETAT